MTFRRHYAAWGASRLLLFVLVALPRVGGPALFTDVNRYAMWGRGIADWSAVPYRDFGWEYPPGAAPLVTLPAFASHDLYASVFALLMLAADLAVLAALTRLAARLGSDRGVWLWVGGVLLLGPIVLTRYDTVSALLAVLSALGVAAGAPYAAGLALGGGVVTKLWPGLLLLALPLVRGWRRVLAAAAATVLVSLAAVLGVGGAAHGAVLFERHADRGLQVESVPATPLLVADRAGADVGVEFDDVTSFSWDLVGAGVDAALLVSALGTLAALGGATALAWRARRTPEAWLDVAATALLLVTVTGKVLSPQYVVWLLALLAAALCRRGSPLLVPGVLVAASGVLTQAVFPATYDALVRHGDVLPVVLLALRNLLLVVAAIFAVRAVWRASAVAAEQAA